MNQPNETSIPSPSKEELLHAYLVAVRSRAMEQHIVRLVSRGEVKFAIWGPGEEIHGTATALALSRFVGPERFGMVPHYRSGTLCSMWCELNGYQNFSQTLLRQQFSKETDPMSGGRQMVYHLDIEEVGILPVQSPVGMQLGKAAGYAKGMHLKGIRDGITMGIVGDGTTAEGDMHDAMNAASVCFLSQTMVLRLVQNLTKGVVLKILLHMQKVLESVTSLVMVAIFGTFMKRHIGSQNTCNKSKSRYSFTYTVFLA